MSKAHKDLQQMDAEFEASGEGYGFQLQLDFAEILWRRLNALGWTQAEFAKKVGWEPEYVEHVLHGTMDSTLSGIGVALHTLGVRGRLQTGNH